MYILIYFSLLHVSTDKLSALLEDKKASKLTEKIFTIYDDTKAAQKSKKRVHTEDKEKEKDVKKSRFRDDDMKTEKVPETQLSADKVSCSAIVCNFIIFNRSKIYYAISSCLYTYILLSSLDKTNDG